MLSDVAVLFGAWDQLSGIAGLLVMPIAVWEFSLGVYMTVKGFRDAELTETERVVSTGRRLTPTLARAMEGPDPCGSGPSSRSRIA